MKDNSNTNSTEAEATKNATSKSLVILKKTFCITGWIILSLVGIILILTTLVVWILTPARLTPIVEDFANKKLNADVSIEKVELSFWRSFPKITLDIDSISIISKSIPDSVCKKYHDADSLLAVGHIHAGMNLALLSIGEIALYDVDINSLNLNLISINDSVSNFNILNLSDNEHPKTSTSFPDITINRFSINSAQRIRYVSIADSTDISINLRNLNFAEKNAPEYALNISAEGKSPLLQKINRTSVEASLNGKIQWNRKKTGDLQLNNFKLEFDSLNAEFSTSLSISDPFKFESFEFKLPSWQISRLCTMLPHEYAKNISGLETDMVFTLCGKLSEPYIFSYNDSTLSIPSFHSELEIPSCHIYWDRLHFNSFSASASLKHNASQPEKSIVEIKNLSINGNVLKLDASSVIEGPFNDPHINGKIKADFKLNTLPKSFLKKYASELKGKILSDISLRAHLSDFSKENFHRVLLKGDIDLKDIRYLSLDSATNVFINNTCVKFGTNKQFVSNAGVHVDSLFSASLKVDTLNIASGPSVRIALADISGGVGVRITGEKIDTSTIVPIGSKLNFRRLEVDDIHDSLKIRLVNTGCNASLRRFKGDRKAPHLSALFDAERVFVLYKKDIVGLLNGHIDASINLRKKEKTNRKDSAHRRTGKHRYITELPDNTLDIELSSGLKAAMNRWNLTGSVRADKGGFRTTFLPTKNSLRNVDISFSSDSIVLRNLGYKLGSSDFLINGTISNILRAVTRKRNNTLNIDFSILSDTINVNEISRLLMTSSSHHEDKKHHRDDDIFSENPSDNTLSFTDTTTRAFLVPSNINASLLVKANNILYTDILFHDFCGEVLVDNNAINLRNLEASTDIGKLNLTALYSAPSLKNIEFGMGLKIDRFQMGHLSSVIPAIDTILPLLKDFSGIISADVAAASSLDSLLNFELPTLRAAIKLTGDSLVLIDADTFKSLAKWLLFKNKKRNMIDKMSVEIVVENNRLELFPMFFDIDRYRLGVMGTNDLALNLNYHISVLKSPLPFKFGINIFGPIDHLKFRIGGAKLKNNQVAESMSIADTTRINLVNQIENIFRRSASSHLTLPLPRQKVNLNLQENALSHQDSVVMIREGLIDAPTNFNDTISNSSLSNSH